MGCSNAVYFPVKILKSQGFSIDFFSTNKDDDFNEFSKFNNEKIIDDFFLVNLSKKDKINPSRVTNAVLYKFQEIIRVTHYDFIYIHYIDWADLIRYSEIPPNTKLIYHMHDSSFIQHFYCHGNKEIGKIFQNEVNALKYFNAVICLSFEEMSFWSKLCPEKDFYFIPPTNSLRILPKADKNIDVLYIAAYNPYNIAGACWFLDNIYPLLENNISICFCGKFLTGLTPEYLGKISAYNITTLDYVDNLEELYSKTKIVIVPILKGTGIKIKTLEAMSYSIPIITTIMGVDGFPDKYENGCLVTNNPLEFASNIDKLLNDENLYKSVISNQNTYYNKYFSYERNVYNLKEVFKYKNINKKINMLYDATFLAQCTSKDAIRSGIYFVAYNLLRQFSKSTLFNITLYIQDGHNFSHFQNDSLLSRFPILIKPKDKYKHNINNHKKNIKTTNNIFLKLLFLMKIVKNYLFYIFSSIYNKRNLFNYFNVYFSPLYTTPFDIIKSSIKQFTVLYDAIPFIYPQYYPDITSNNYWFNKLIKAINKKNYYFCVSESTKNDFLKFCGNRLDSNKIFVTYPAPAQIFFPDYNIKKLKIILDKYKVEYKNNHKYVFSFCTQKLRKNLIFTIRCFIYFLKKHQIDDLFFYIGGAQWDFFVNQLEEQVSDYDNYRDKIIRLGYIDDEDVNILYSNSLFFTYLSQYEGFGLPPLEAMQAGTPVITSNNSSLPEVVGDAAIMIDYNNEEQCIKVFEDLYFKENLRKEYVAKGIERANMFSWEKCVCKMIDVFKDVTKCEE